MSTRRSFLYLSSTSLAAALVPGTALAQRVGGLVFTPGTLGAYAQGLLSQSSLESYVGTLFLAFLEHDTTAYMRLSQVIPLTAAPVSAQSPVNIRPSSGVHSARLGSAQPGMQAYLAIFQTGGVMIPQDTYVLDHGRLGRFAVFLVPGIDTQGNPTAVASFASISGI